MKRLLVIGAGDQGGPCASIPAGEAGVEEIRLGDIDLTLAERVVDRINSDKVVALHLDLSKREEVIAPETYTFPQPVVICYSPPTCMKSPTWSLDSIGTRGCNT